MNKDEFALLQARMQNIALRALLDWLADFLRLKFSFLSPAERQATFTAVHEKLEGARREYSTIALPHLPPEMSDLQSAEFQEAFDALSKDLEQKIRGGT